MQHDVALHKGVVNKDCGYSGKIHKNVDSLPWITAHRRRSQSGRLTSTGPRPKAANSFPFPSSPGQRKSRSLSEGSAVMTHIHGFWIRKLKSAEEILSSLQSVLVCCEVSLSRLGNLNTQSPVGILFWKVVETLRGGASPEEVGHWGGP